jgi:hypothetical protein
MIKAVLVAIDASFHFTQYLHLQAFDDTTEAHLARVARTWMSSVSDPKKSSTDEPTN